jgi:hypothetical protein
MKVPDGEEPATRTSSESCASVRKGRGEALTGGRVGRVLSRVRKQLRGADAVQEGGRQQPLRRYRETHRSPARSLDPAHARMHHAWEPGDPKSARGDRHHGSRREAQGQ